MMIHVPASSSKTTGGPGEPALNYRIAMAVAVLRAQLATRVSTSVVLPCFLLILTK